MLVNSYRLYLFVLLFCPLAFGTVEYWSLATLEIVTSFSFLLLGFFWFSEEKSSYKVPGMLPMFLLLGWMFFQLLPLPPSLVHFISPATFEIYRPLIELDPSYGWIPLTLNPKATLLSLLTFSSYVLFYMMTVYHLSDGERLKKTVIIITTLGVVIAIEAILQKLTSPEAIYWLRSVPPSSTPIGPWVYSNHFAGFMTMLFPLAVALFLFNRPRIHYEKNLREKLVTLFTMPGSNRYLLLGTGVILMAVSILLSISRGGIITLCLAFLFFTLLSARITPNREIKWGIVISASVVLIITWLGWDPIMTKFSTIWGEQGLNTSGRLPVFQDSLNIIGTFPFFGTGFGTFIDIYPAFRTLPGDAVFDHAHNDYIELLTDGGLVGFILCAWFLYAISNTSIKTLRKRREQYSILITSGALTGMLALLLHCFVDFQMHNGANGLYFFFLCGLAVSGAHTRLQYRTRPSFLKNIGPKAIIFPTVLALAVLCSSTWYTLGMYRALRAVAPMQEIFLNRHIPEEKLKEIHTVFSRAARLDPLEAGYRYRQGHVSTFLEKDDQAGKEFLQAGMLNPMSGLYIQQIGLSLPTEKKNDAETFLGLGIKREHLILDRYLTSAHWYIMNKDKDKSIEILNRAFLTIPDKAATTAKFVLKRGFSRSDMQRILPRKADAWYEMGRIMERANNLVEAEYFYLQALELFDIRDVVPAYFSQLYNLYRRQKNEDKALAILRMGVEYIPDYSWFRIQLGDYYLHKGIPYRAKEEYQQGLRFDPDNITLRKKLDELE